MGKAAKNEQLKIRATFYNNVSVGCLLAGFIVPYLGLYQWMASIDSGKGSLNADIINAFNFDKTYWNVAGTIIALILSYLFHKHAKSLLEDVED